MCVFVLRQIGSSWYKGLLGKYGFELFPGGTLSVKYSILTG